MARKRRIRQIATLQIPSVVSVSSAVKFSLTDLAQEKLCDRCGLGVRSLDRGGNFLDGRFAASTDLRHADPHRARRETDGAFLPRGDKPPVGCRNAEPL